MRGRATEKQACRDARLIKQVFVGRVSPHQDKGEHAQLFLEYPPFELLQELGANLCVGNHLLGRARSVVDLRALVHKLVQRRARWQREIYVWFGGRGVTGVCGKNNIAA